MLSILQGALTSTIIYYFVATARYRKDNKLTKLVTLSVLNQVTLIE